MPVLVLVIPVPVMAFGIGFAGGYAAEKWIQHAEPVINRKIDEMQVRKAMRKANRAAVKDAEHQAAQAA